MRPHVSCCCLGSCDICCSSNPSPICRSLLHKIFFVLGLQPGKHCSDSRFQAPKKGRKVHDAIDPRENGVINGPLVVETFSLQDVFITFTSPKSVQQSETKAACAVAQVSLDGTQLLSTAYARSSHAM